MQMEFVISTEHHVRQGGVKMKIIPVQTQIVAAVYATMEVVGHRVVQHQHIIELIRTLRHVNMGNPIMRIMKIGSSVLHTVIG
jgi:hypothetical protein